MWLSSADARYPDREALLAVNAIDLYLNLEDRQL